MVSVMVSEEYRTSLVKQPSVGVLSFLSTVLPTMLSQTDMSPFTSVFRCERPVIFNLSVLMSVNSVNKCRLHYFLIFDSI
jgi:hypothetical protein